MHSRKRFLTAAILATLAGAILAWWMQAQRATLATAEVERVALERARITAASAALAREVATVRKSVPASSAPGATTGPAAAPAPAPAQRGGFDVQTLFAEHPGWQALYEAGDRAGFQLRYAALIQALGLSDAQRDLLTAELSRYDLNLQAVGKTAGDRQWAPDDPRTQDLRQAEDARHAAQLTQLLGEAGYRQFREFDRTANLRDLVGDFALQLSAMNAPLSADAAEQLIQSLARHTDEWQGKSNRNAIKWDAVLVDAQAILPPDQFAQLRRVGEANEIERQMNRIIARAAQKKTGGRE